MRIAPARNKSRGHRTRQFRRIPQVVRVSREGFNRASSRLEVPSPLHGGSALDQSGCGTSRWCRQTLHDGPSKGSVPTTLRSNFLYARSFICWSWVLSKWAERADARDAGPATVPTSGAIPHFTPLLPMSQISGSCEEDPSNGEAKFAPSRLGQLSCYQQVELRGAEGYRETIPEMLPDGPSRPNMKRPLIFRYTAPRGPDRLASRRLFPYGVIGKF